jgi:hypothetical protein
MTDPPRRREVFANPFFVVLLGTSVLFVLTITLWLFTAWRVTARPPPGPGVVNLSGWLDRHSTVLISVEFLVMLLAGVLAMLTDPLFSPRSKSKRAADR